VFASPKSSDLLTRCEEFYGLKDQPFSLTPDLRFVYPSRSHSQAFEQVAQALHRREGLIVITGEIGTGKTVLCRSLLETFHEARTFLSVILDPLLGVDDLLYQVLGDFGITARNARTSHAPLPDATRHQLVTTLQQFLASLIPLNAHAVIMVDEAQHLTAPVLEQIRLLSNFETDRAKLLQIVLVGQPNLETLLRQPEMRQLDQRVARRIQLHPLSEMEVQDYIERRLAVASAPTVPFTASAMRTVHAISNGIPRVVNTVCDRALDIGCERQLRTLDDDVVRAAAERLKLSTHDRPAPIKPAAARPASPVAAAIAGVLLVVVVGGWMWMRGAQPTQTPAPAPAAAPQQTPAAPPKAAAPAAAQPAPQPATPTTDATRSQPASASSTPPPQAAPPAGGYRIAVAAFRTSKRAVDVASEIAAKGLPVATHTDSTGQWYQVVVGPFATAEAAANAQRTLAREGYPDTRVTSGQPER
jgi:general secretion pathway protein A